MKTFIFEEISTGNTIFIKKKRYSMARNHRIISKEGIIFDIFQANDISSEFTISENQQNDRFRNESFSQALPLIFIDISQNYIAYANEKKKYYLRNP